MSTRLKAHLALLTVALAYGANYIVAKGLMPDKIGPSGFIFMRVVGATLLFWLLFASRSERIEKKDWLRLIVCGLTGVAMNQLLFFNGLNLTSPINASIIMVSNPIMVLLASALLLKQRITGIKVLGVVLGAAGAIGLLTLASGGLSGGNPKGDIMILLNAMSYGIYLVAVKPLMTKYRPLTVITWVFTFGLLFVAPIGFSQFQAIVWGGFTNSDYLALAFVVVVVTFLVYLLNLYALRHLLPTTVSAYIYLQPITAGLTAWLVSLWGVSQYVDDITWEKIAFALLIFFGVYLVSKPQSKSLQKK